MLQINSVNSGNCLDLMNDIDDKSIDMILCDLPYGTTACKWDTVIPFEPLWAHYKRIIKDNGAIVLTASQPFTSALVMSNIKMFKYCWVWRKSKASNFLHAPNMPLKVLEDICVFSHGIVGHISQAKEKRVTYNPQGIRQGETVVKQKKNTSELKYHRESQTNHTTGYKCKAEGYPDTLLIFKSDSRLHPTQKPVALFEYLIKTYTNEGELVLDNCAGSGTTAIACLRTNRNYILIEQETKYCDIANKRIAEFIP